MPKMKSVTTKPSKPHASLENVGQERAVLPGPLAVDAVVGAHHRGDAFRDHAPEVGQVDLVQRARGNGHIDLEARVLHGVQGVMLDAGHHVALHAARQRRPHGAEMLGSSP